MGFTRIMRRLKRDEGGNAMLLVALGMPVLIGSSGAAVDVAQWYVWKRELQYAADQAALAGAWASAEPEQAANYVSLANLEFKNNLQVLSGKVPDPTVTKADWNGGTDNTVVAESSYSKALPFTSILWKNQATVKVRAQASYQAATNYTTCMLALDPDADDAFVIGGSMGGAVTCGVGALSNSASAIRKNGQTTIDVADLISAGGIDEDLAVNGQIHEFISNLSNPFDGATPPDSPTTRTYSCDTSTTTTSGESTADIRRRTVITYKYYQGTNLNSANTEVTYTGTGAQTNSDTTTVSYSQSLTFTPAEGYNDQISDTEEQYTGNNYPSTAHHNKSIYEFRREVVTDTYVNVVSSSGGTVSGTANGLLPGTYGDITIGCDTTFNPGVYVITGVLDFGSNHTVQGNNVMFVFTGDGDERWKLNSQSIVNFTGITYDQLVNEYSVSAADAEILNGMIIYDPNSTANIQINGGADTTFEGVLYMPNRFVKFNGNSSTSGSCMMIAAGTMEITGTADIASLCLPTNVNSFEVGGTTISVRLVA